MIVDTAPGRGCKVSVVFPLGQAVSERPPKNAGYAL